MSLDLEFAEFAVAGTAVGLAAVNQLWCAAGGRPVRAANRLMGVALLVNLLLGGAATIDWADDSIRGVQTATFPPLLWPLTLFAVGALTSLATVARRRTARSATDRAAGRRLRPDRPAVR
jgi:hypothetical protein